MAIFKCKMCGGELTFEPGESTGVCDYCGAEQTLPKVMDENLQGLFNRANVLRMKAEFDKAAEIYEKILQASGTEAEAYWGLILCKYGIEYVEDPVTYKRVPTCHRASFDAVTADDDYKMAVQYADLSQRMIFENEAKQIDEIQKGIVALAQNEEPYDVFICYKETGNDGKRTVDSVIANDIYHQLTQEGYKVFYAAITLEDKLGQEYEPYIFSALNSSKVMLSIGTKPEYFNAVWVKNEWSRFLKIMKKDRARMLIPCYKDMDAYELPEEFAHLQAQDMSKIGFINDIVRGIKKVVVKDSAMNQSQNVTNIAAAQQAMPVNGNIVALLQRGELALEDKEWDDALGYYDDVLNQNAQCAEAYLGKLLAELKVCKKEDLANMQASFDNNKNYQKVIRFADASLKTEMEGYINTIETRKLDAIYVSACKMFKQCDSQEKALETMKEFQKISGFKDSKEYITKCENLVENLRIKSLVKTLSEKLEKSYNETDVAEVINSIDEKDRNIPEINLLIEQSRDIIAKRTGEFRKLWEQYCSVRNSHLESSNKLQNIGEKLKKNITAIKIDKEKIKKLDDKIAEINSIISHAKEDIPRLKAQQSSIVANIKNDEAEIEKLQIQLRSLNNELSALGIFALKQKKDISEKINYTEQLLEEKKRKLNEKVNNQNIVKNNLMKYDNLESYISDVTALNFEKQEIQNRTNNNEEEIRVLEKDSEPLRIEEEQILAQEIEIAQSLVETKYLYSIPNDLYESFLSDSNIINIITMKKTYVNIIQNYMMYDALPEDIKMLYGRKIGGIDYEAIYYQACQALEFAKSDADIIWAKGEFEQIQMYKDSLFKLQECNKLLAGV